MVLKFNTYKKAEEKMTYKNLLAGQKIIPVVSVENEAQTIGLTETLLECGINVIEITLRTNYAIDALSLVKKRFPDMITLAGTVTNAANVKAVSDAGVDGIISPGISAELIESVAEKGLPFLPGVSSASEIILAQSYGLFEGKLFPAEVVGGIAALKAFKAPFPNFKFCPTGGVNAANYQDYLSLPNVLCIGGSWIAPSKKIQQEDWQAIKSLCDLK